MALQILWYCLWGLLWAVYFMLDGFDFGAGMLRGFLSRTEEEKEASLAAIGPVWNGNEVWLITAGGATFAAFPATYASMFSFLYLPMLLILFSLIVRGVSIEFREKSNGARWRKSWDRALTISSLTAPLVLALGFGNIFEGLRIQGGVYQGGFWPLFNPYGLLTAVLFIALFLHHGSLWLEYRCSGPVSERAHALAPKLWWVLLAVAAVFLVVTAFATKLLANYLVAPILFLVPIASVAALVASRMLHARGKALGAFLASCGTVLLVVTTALVGLFPNLLPSSVDTTSSLTAFNSSSSQYTLRLMAIVALVFVPIVVLYQTLVYRFFRSKVRAEEGGY